MEKITCLGNERIAFAACSLTGINELRSPNNKKKTVIDTCGPGRAELTPIQLYVCKKRSLNKRTELVSKYRHENRFYLYNFPPAVRQTGSPPFSDFSRFYFQFSDVLVILQRSVFAVLEFFDFFDFFRLFLTSRIFWSFRIFSNSFWLFPISPIFSNFSNVSIFFRFFLIYIFGFLRILFWFSVFYSCPNYTLVLNLPSIFSNLYLPNNFCQTVPCLSCTLYNPLPFPAHLDHTSIQGFEFFCSLSTWG